LAKSLCGGLPGGAMLTTHEIAPSLRPGMHAATFGGNPISARAGIAALEMIESENLLEGVDELADIFRRRFTELQSSCDLVKEVRVLGMMVGVELSGDGSAVVQSCLERNLLINCTQGTVIRLLPAMNLTAEQANEGCDIICEAIQSLG